MDNDELLRWSVYFGRRNQEAELAAARAQSTKGR
jgi:hypothetical protein